MLPLLLSLLGLNSYRSFMGRARAPSESRSDGRPAGSDGPPRTDGPPAPRTDGPASPAHMGRGGPGPGPGP